MRALFLELLVDRVLAEGLGIGHGCLYEMARQIDSILERHRNELADRQTFLRAYADLAEFVSRMAADARAGDFPSCMNVRFSAPGPSAA